MLKFIAGVFLLPLFAFASPATTTVRGRISNFQGETLPAAVIEFKDDNFKTLYSTVTDENGEFKIEVETRKYKAIYAVKDYAVNYLEFWYWDYWPNANQSLAIQIDGLEVYGMKAWSAKPTYPGVLAYFRPMSLKRWIAAGKPKTPAAIAPDLSPKDIEAFINGKKVDVWNVNKVKEVVDGDGGYLDAYLINVSDPDSNGHQTLCLRLKDSQTAEQGMGCIDF